MFSMNCEKLLGLAEELLHGERLVLVLLVSQNLNHPLHRLVRLLVRLRVGHAVGCDSRTDRITSDALRDLRSLICVSIAPFLLNIGARCGQRVKCARGAQVETCEDLEVRS